MATHGNIPSFCWWAYNVSRLFCADSVSPVVANATAVDTPISPGQITRSRLAPSTRIEVPLPQVALFAHPLGGAGLFKAAFPPITDYHGRHVDSRRIASATSHLPLPVYSCPQNVRGCRGSQPTQRWRSNLTESTSMCQQGQQVGKLMSHFFKSADHCRPCAGSIEHS
jgi:hypothetical protein